MFRGVNYINLDAKGRMAFPSKYRDRLQALCDGELIVTLETDDCLLIYPAPEWEIIEQKVARLPTMERRSRQLQRILIGHATDCQLDGAGRILLPAPLRSVTGLDKNTVLIGQGNKFEVWDQATWETRRDEWLSEAAEESELSQELAALSL